MMEDVDPDRVERSVFVVAERHGGLDGPWSASTRARLIHVHEGVLSVRTGTGWWVLPPRHALWILPDVLYGLSAQGPVWLHSLYVDAETVAPVLPAQCRAVAVDALVEALLITIAALPPHAPLDEPAARLVQVLLDRLPGLPVAPLALNLPLEPRIRRIADALIAHPADQAVLDELAGAVGVTSRTAARLFVKESGQTFGHWRQQLRLLIALERLGYGASVTQVALEVGYHDVSSFIALFRDTFGETPARYFR